MTFRRLASLLAASALALAVGLVTSGAPAGAAESDTTGAEHTSAILVQPITTPRSSAATTAKTTSNTSCSSTTRSATR